MLTFFSPSPSIFILRRSLFCSIHIFYSLVNNNDVVLLCMITLFPAFSVQPSKAFYLFFNTFLAELKKQKQSELNFFNAIVFPVVRTYVRRK